MERRSGEELIDEMRLNFREITNPLSAIMGLSRQLFASRSPQVVTEIASTIYAESFDLDLQLRNIFAAAELEAGQAAIRRTNVNVNSLLAQVVNSLRRRASGRNVSISYQPELSDEPVWNIFCRTDADKLELVLQNLLATAIDFSRRGAEVNIEAFKASGFLNVDFHDFCKGASKENQRIINDLFRRLETGVRGFQYGPELGLNVTMSLIELLNGRIALSPEKGRGFVCEVFVPDMEEDGMPDSFSQGGSDIVLGKG